MAVEMKATAPARREGWGSLRKLPSGRWQARYPAPDGGSYTARTDDDKPLTFLTGATRCRGAPGWQHLSAASLKPTT